MPKAFHLFVLTCLLLPTAWAQASAQSAPSATQTAEIVGELAEVRVEGVSNPTTESLVRVRLVARPGTPVESLNLEAERNRVYNLGTFSEVSVSLEASGDGPVMVVRVRENPPIGAVELRGSQLRTEAVLAALQQENLIEVGSPFNSARAQEAVETLQAIYRQAVGFPGTVPVTLTVLPMVPGEAPPPEAEEGEGEAAPASVDFAEAEALRLIYTVDESPPLDTLTFAGATVLGESELRDLFRPLENATAFDLQLYTEAVQRVADAYEARGFRGSGVDAQRSELVGGTLRVQLVELTILSLDTTAIGVAPGELSLQPGDLFNYDALLADVRRLAEGGDRDIRLETQTTPEGGVRVTFTSEPPGTAGPITAVRLEGNTVLTDDELLEVLTLGVGDTFTSALAQEDFARLNERYAAAGYVLVPEPNFNFLDGTYVQRLREVRIAGYEVDLGESPRTNPEVITRYLPPVGSVYNQNAVQRGVLQISRLQIVQPTQIGLLPTEDPSEQIVRFAARELPSRTLRPSAELTTEGGVAFGTDLSVSDTNLFGEAHRASASISARTSDLGFLVGGSLAYTVPWLYVDFLDFQEVATELSGEIFSEVVSNQPLTFEGGRRVCLGGGECPDEERVLIGEYTQRDSGFRFGVGRPVIPNLSASLTARFTRSDYALEPPAEVCAPGAITDTCALPLEQARAFVPQAGFSSFVGSSLAYDTRDNPEFAREGYRLTLGGGVGFGNDFSVAGVQQGYTYQQLELGARTYVAPFENRNHVFAFRANAGHQFGAEYPESRLFVVGDTNNEATQIRGYRREDISPAQTYATATAEYRYDFGLATAVTQTVVGLAFVDLGYASSVGAALLPSAGVGLQINIGFGGGLAIPPLRLDYGFSPAHPTGVFGFRLGFNF
jgi:outer membrane protein insertion porin family